MTSVIEVKTSGRNQFIDVTAAVQKAVKESGVESGVCIVYTPHTTAAVTINENADPSVKSDIIGKLAEIFPHDGNYQHLEGNADAHLKSSVVGCSETLMIEERTLLLGTWQGIMFCEFDGPRNRRLMVKVISD